MKKALIAASLALAATGSQAYTLDFGSNPLVPPLNCSVNADGSGPMTLCGDGAGINQGYGDVAGVVDVSYSDANAAAPTTLNWWSTGYSDLYGVLWANQIETSYARIELIPLGGGTVNLTRFDMGAFGNKSFPTRIDIYDLGKGPKRNDARVFEFSGDVPSGSAHRSFEDLNLSSSVGFWIEWQDSASNVGIDNIGFTVTATPIPEPETYALMLAGLGLLGFAARRRR